MSWHPLAFMVAFLFACFFYPSFTKTATLGEVAYEKLKENVNLKDKKIILIDQKDGTDKLNNFKYYFYNETHHLEGGAYEPLPSQGGKTVVEKENFKAQLKSYDVIIVLATDAWINEVLSELTQYKLQEKESYILVKREKGYEIL